MADPIWFDVEIGKDSGRDALSLYHQPEQDVLRTDVVVTQLHSFPEGQFQHLLRARRERHLHTCSFFAVADDALYLFAHLVQGNAQRGQRLDCDARTFLHHTEQDVLGAYVIVVETTRLLLREDHDLAGPLREPLEHAIEPPAHPGEQVQSNVFDSPPTALGPKHCFGDGERFAVGAHVVDAKEGRALLVGEHRGGDGAEDALLRLPDAGDAPYEPLA